MWGDAFGDELASHAQVHLKTDHPAWLARPYTAGTRCAEGWAWSPSLDGVFDVLAGNLVDPTVANNWALGCTPLAQDPLTLSTIGLYPTTWYIYDHPDVYKFVQYCNGTSNTAGGYHRIYYR